MEISIPLLTIVIEVVIAVITVGVAWGVVKATLSAHGRRITSLEETLEKQDKEKADKDDHERLERQFMEHSRDGIGVREDIAAIKADIKNIDKKLDRMNGHH